MKKFFFFAAAVVSMVACQKEAQLSSNDVTAPIEEGAPVAVEFNSNVKASVATKAQGSVDAWNATQDLYVYGFQRAAQVDYANPFINNVKAVSPAEGTEGKLELLNTEGNPFYYAGNNTYDFYGYYVDDAKYAEIQTSEAGVCLTNLTITGGQDVMLAKADQAADYNAAVENGVFTGDVNNWKIYYAYSAYAARRHVHPTLKFEHQLVQFKFEIESGSENAVEEELKVVGLELDANTTADLYVAGSELGLKNVRTPAPVQLFGFDTEAGYAVPNMPAEAAQIGGCLMVIPNVAVEGENDQFKGRLYLTQKGASNAAPVDFTLEFNKENVDFTNVPEDLTSFAAGYSFTVKVTVYSLERVEATAVLTPWENGGNLDINTDEAPVPVE